jgi:pre-rRNA-processing protein IPI3
VQPRPPATENDNGGALPAERRDGLARTSDLEDEVVRLKAQLARAKGINDVMWETLMQSAAAPDQIPGGDSREDADDGRERKRGKTKA